MKRALSAPLMATILMITACSSNEPTEITATGDDPSLRLEAWCEGDGVMSMAIKYGRGEADTFLVGDTPIVDVLGGKVSHSRSYGQPNDAIHDAALWVSATPSEGTCFIELKDLESGNMLEREVKNRDIEITGIVPA